MSVVKPTHIFAVHETVEGKQRKDVVQDSQGVKRAHDFKITSPGELDLCGFEAPKPVGSKQFKVQYRECNILEYVVHQRRIPQLMVPFHFRNLFPEYVEIDLLSEPNREQRVHEENGQSRNVNFTVGKQIVEHQRVRDQNCGIIQNIGVNIVEV